MKYQILILTMVSLLTIGCLVEPVDIYNDIECTPEAFVGEWEFISTEFINSDTIPNIIIELADEEDKQFGKILIDGRLFHVNATAGCETLAGSALADIAYELTSEDELIKKIRVLAVFGSASRYRRI